MPLPQNVFGNHTLNSINPYVRRAYYDTMQPPKEIKPRIIYDYEIIYIKSGAPTIVIEDEEYSPVPGDLFFIRPGQRHSIRTNSAPLVQPHIHFDLIYQADSTSVPVSYMPQEAMSAEEISHIRRDIAPSIIDPFPSFIRLSNPLYVEQLIFEVIYAYNNPELYPEMQVKWRFLRLLDQILCEISWLNSGHKNLRAERAGQIRLYLEHHSGHAVTMAELAEVYHLDESYISRIFKRAYGMSPIRFHLVHRLQRASEMIHYTNLPITDIALRFGFSSLQDFSRAFRRIEGIPPSALRKAGRMQPGQETVN